MTTNENENEVIEQPLSYDKQCSINIVESLYEKYADEASKIAKKRIDQGINKVAGATAGGAQPSTLNLASLD